MSEITENQKEYRLILKAASHFSKVNAKVVAEGVRATYGQVRGSNHMAIHNYIFDKVKFKSADEAKAWFAAHVRHETLTAMDFKVWNEYRKAALSAYMEASKLR